MSMSSDCHLFYVGGGNPVAGYPAPFSGGQRRGYVGLGATTILNAAPISTKTPTARPTLHMMVMETPRDTTNINTARISGDEK